MCYTISSPILVLSYFLFISLSFSPVLLSLLTSLKLLCYFLPFI